MEFKYILLEQMIYIKLLI